MAFALFLTACGGKGDTIPAPQGGGAAPASTPENVPEAAPSAPAFTDGEWPDHEYGDVYNASIHGRPIVSGLNRSCFVRDMEGVNAYGMAALNVTGHYFSDFEINGKTHFEDWAARELAERKHRRREFIVKTHRAVFNARIGAKVQIAMRNEQLEGVITGFSIVVIVMFGVIGLKVLGRYKNENQ